MQPLKLKQCNICNENKELILFYNCKKAADGKQYTCKSCQKKSEDFYKRKYPKRYQSRRRNRLLRDYGITPEDYDKMLAEQDSKCKICKNSDVDHWRTDKLFIDHNHATGKVRGLLCHHCNYALGGFKDSIKLLEEAIQYLKGNE